MSWADTIYLSTIISIWDYIFMRTCILSLHLVAPLSILYSLGSSLLPMRVPRLLEIWLIMEAAFYFLVFIPRRSYLQRPAVHPNVGDRESRQRLYQRCYSNIPDPERYLSKWFRDAPKCEIRWENVKDFYRWAFFNTDTPDAATEEELEGYVGGLEKLLGRPLQPGRGNVRAIRMTLDKVEMLHRSLTWYMCVFVVDSLTFVYLQSLSFCFYRPPVLSWLAVFPPRPFALFTAYKSPAEILSYWYRPHFSKKRLPILFIHGIGVGLYPYIDFLADVCTPESGDGQIGIIAVEIMAISSRLTMEALLKDRMCKEIECIIMDHGWDRFMLVSHSYGSVIATHLLRNPQINRMIGPVFFIDPVSFLLHLPDVAYNFTYRLPTKTKEYQLWYFGAKDMGVSHTLFRRFFWTENVLWKEDMQGHRVAVALAGKDTIVDAETIKAYLIGAEGSILQIGSKADGIRQRSNLEVLWFQDLDHGQVFKSNSTRCKLVDIINEFCLEA
ncbi:hypothetical protein BX600DRAFT_416310 [Xylariales sp. PMI_506]|nr:hypothetical protein BX600DRAFT_416310 [Xylariales sp. PMI_506]